MYPFNRIMKHERNYKTIKNGEKVTIVFILFISYKGIKRAEDFLIPSHLEQVSLMRKRNHSLVLASLVILIISKC